MQSSKNSKPCNAPAFPASASQINAMVSLQYRIERHGVADDLGGSRNLGSGESVRVASCSGFPAPQFIGAGLAIVRILKLAIQTDRSCKRVALASVQAFGAAPLVRKGPSPPG